MNYLRFFIDDRVKVKKVSYFRMINDTILHRFGKSKEVWLFGTEAVLVPYDMYLEVQNKLRDLEKENQNGTTDASSTSQTG